MHERSLLATGREPTRWRSDRALVALAIPLHVVLAPPHPRVRTQEKYAKDSLIW